MIVKKAAGWHVQSESGKNLGGPYPTYEAAAKRLEQVEYFKAHPAPKGNTRALTRKRRSP